MPLRRSLFITITALTLLASGCSGGPCPAGLVGCGPACIDPMTSRTYCGASLDCKGTNAGVVCSRGQVCSGGQCKNDTAELENLALSEAALSPPFSGRKVAYSASVPMCMAMVTVAATATEPQAQLIVNGGPAATGTISTTIALASGADTVTVEVVAPSGRRSAYTIDVLTEGSAYLKPFNTDRDDFFGDVAISRTGDTLAIGARNESSSATGIDRGERDNSAPQSGAVYIFTRTGTTWSQQAYIKASNTGTGDNFGSSVALSESGDTLAVGAVGEDSTASGVGRGDEGDGSQESGAVYVFTRSNGTWKQQAYIKASNNDEGDQFGSSVALAGNTLAVGAHFESSNGSGPGNNAAQRSGAVYLFTRTGTTWSQQAYIKASHPDTGDAFGGAVALASAGDVLAVGAPYECSNASGVDGDDQNDSSAMNSGAVYVFIRSGATWTQQAYVKASNTDPYDNFGLSVSLAEDGDTLAVGAYQEGSSTTGVNGNQADNSADSSGAAYVFTRSGTTWSQQAYIKASNTEFADSFGISVSLAPSGDMLAVGATNEDSSGTGPGANQADNNASSSGAAYLFVRSGATWAQRAYFKASNTGANDFFGGSVALSSDVLAVGARKESSNATGVDGDQTNDNAPNSGAAYVFACY